MATNPTAELKGTVAATGTETPEDTTRHVDHGFRAWTVVAGAWCCLFCGFGWVNGTNDPILIFSPVAASL